MRRFLQCWWFWTGTGFILVVLVASRFLIPLGEGTISPANYDRIKLNMSEDQVYKLLGNARKVWESTTGDSSHAVRWETSWGDENGNEIVVTFGIVGPGLEKRVTGKRFVPKELTFLERMNLRIELRIQALWP